MYLEKDANGGYYASFSTIARDFGQLEVDFFQIGGPPASRRASASTRSGRSRICRRI